MYIITKKINKNVILSETKNLKALVNVNEILHSVQNDTFSY